jgi:hypothetical protein
MNGFILFIQGFLIIGIERIDAMAGVKAGNFIWL